MKNLKLIGKTVLITNRDSWCYGESGIIKGYDGEYYHIAITGHEDVMLIFARDEFKVKKDVKK